MRPVVVTAVLLLGALMFVSESSAGQMENIAETCNFTPTPCERITDDEGWYQMGDGRCVKVFNAQYLTFNDAERACNEYTSDSIGQGHLVSIHSYEELTSVVCAIYRVNPERYPYWIGLYLSFHFEDYLIYDWTDGTQQNFTSFADREPNFMDENQYCIEINFYIWGLWNDVSCNSVRPYVCAV